MVLYYSIRWERLPKVPPAPRSRGPSSRNRETIRVTLLNQQGQLHTVTKLYEGWIGVCTSRIDHVVEKIHESFPKHTVTYQRMGDVKKILPYFEKRLQKGKLQYPSKPFYKIYTSADIKAVGCFFHKYKYSYYEPDDWLARIYIDLCTQYDCHSFYYRWYDLEDTAPHLLDAFRMLPDLTHQPDWTFAAFDLESVPLQGNHIPMGHYPTDRIVMMSLFKWNRQGLQKWILYVLPDGIDQPLAGYAHAFHTEADMLVRFHELLEDVQVVTGYNINAFDFPCIFARLLWLNLPSLLTLYQSRTVGMDLVVQFRGKMTLDLYAYFKTFSGYNLPSFKLDDVARIKLQGETKLAVKTTGLWSWYRHSPLSRDLFEESHVERCFRLLKPDTVSKPEEFGTFRTYLDYCLKDSELVYRLFEKEYVLSFLVERANFTALNAVEALHLGNSRYLLELFKTYGTRLGYFINPAFFDADPSKYKLLLGCQKTYQGALNFCYPETTYQNVSVMDYASMYPSTLLSANLCYGTCSIVSRDEWLALATSFPSLTAIPYRQHSQLDFEQALDPGSQFAYPTFDPARDAWVMVLHREAEGFLPQIVSHFLHMRQHHQQEWKRTRDVYHYNVQLGIKILINSLYGVMANKDSPLAYMAIAMIIVTLSRYQLLGSYHFLKHQGYAVCYADTDSLMVHRWPEEHCGPVNAFLGLPHVQLQFEQRMQRLLILSKKRYVYESTDGVYRTKGFQKKVNGLIEYMSDTILERVWRALFHLPDPKGWREVGEASRGWIVWGETLQHAQYLCRDPKKYAIYRKMKKMDQYISHSCPAVKYLKKYPHRTDDHVEFTYSRADLAVSEVSNWVMDAEDCQWVNFEQLFISQKKIFATLLNMAFWHVAEPPPVDTVLNALRWKRFVLAELGHYHRTKRRLLLLVEPGVKYTFAINDHLPRERRVGRKRKLNLGLKQDEF